MKQRNVWWNNGHLCWSGVSGCFGVGSKAKSRLAVGASDHYLNVFNRGKNWSHIHSVGTLSELSRIDTTRAKNSWQRYKMNICENRAGYSLEGRLMKLCALSLAQACRMDGVRVPKDGRIAFVEVRAWFVVLGTTRNGWAGDPQL